MKNAQRNLAAAVLIVAILGGIIGLIHMNGARAGVQATPWPTQVEPGFHLVTDTFTATDVWIAPAGVTTTVVEAWGGGGGGDEDQGGGGGGAYARSSVAVTPGDAYYVVVGSGGAAGGSNGTASTFATTTVVAAPGLGGGSGGGLGGTTALSTGDIEFAGGNGMVSSGNAPGGSSAGDTGAGQNGTGTSNIATEAGTSNGGWGGAPTVDASPGQAPGGGGKSEAGTNIQTAGGRGEVRITYQVPNTAGYPSVRSATWGRSDVADDATYTITLPETENGDLLLLMFNDVSSPVATPSGWTHLVTAASTDEARTTWFYKTADGTETTEDLVISGALQRRSYHALAIDNFTGVPFVASSTAGATTTIDPPSLDTGASDQYLWIMAANVSNANGSSAVDGGNVASISSGYGSYRNNPMPVNINTHQSIISYKLSESQTDDPGSFSRDTARPHVVFTLAIAGEDVASGAISISSAANQSFTVGDTSTAISTITITDAGTPEITDANNIRIRIPSSFPMTFDTSDTTANIGGTDWDHTGAASEGAAVTVTYEDSNKTVVIPVTADFEGEDDITVSGLSFANFSATASTDNLELEVDNGGTVAATDNRTVAIYGPTISSSVSQEFAAGGASTPIATITITDDPDSPTITAGDDIRIRIPSSFPMTWDTSDTEMTVAVTLSDYADSFNTNDLGVVTADLSGVTYSGKTNTMFVVENGTPRINEYDPADGTNLRTITLTNFLDTEGLDWMGDDLFAIVQERTAGPYLITCDITSGTTSLDRTTDCTTVTPNITITDNGGMEGIAYVADRDIFYVSVEKQAGGGNGGRVFLVERSGTSTELTALGSALSSAGITDLADIAYDPLTEHLFLLGQENSTIIEATASGTIIGTRAVDTGIFTQPEGLDLSPDNSLMLIVGEPDDYQLLTRSLNVTSTVSYEDSGKTLVINVTNNFSAGDTLAFGGLSFTNFSSAASADNLELVVGGSSATVADVDDKTISITGGLSVDIVDASGDPVSTPSILFSATSLSFDFQSTTGTLGVSGQRLRITNDTAGAEWSLSIAATSGTTTLWEGTSTDYDFNDPTANAEDGGDADSVGGRLTIDPSGGTITPQGGCATTGLSLGSSSAFSEGATDSITLLTAGSSADVGCFWDLTDVDLTQTIPAQQEGGDYNIDMTLTVVAI